jgi:hypothetical protein
MKSHNLFFQRAYSLVRDQVIINSAHGKRPVYCGSTEEMILSVLYPLRPCSMNRVTSLSQHSRSVLEKQLLYDSFQRFFSSQHRLKLR